METTLMMSTAVSQTKGRNQQQQEIHPDHAQ